MGEVLQLTTLWFKQLVYVGKTETSKIVKNPVFFSWRTSFLPCALQLLDFLFRLLKRVKLSETGTETVLKSSNNCFDVLTTVSLAQQQKCGRYYNRQTGLCDHFAGSSSHTARGLFLHELSCAILTNYLLIICLWFLFLSFPVSIACAPLSFVSLLHLFCSVYFVVQKDFCLLCCVLYPVFV